MVLALVVILIVVFLFALCQRVYYKKVIELLVGHMERDIEKAECYGRLASLNNAGLVYEAYHRIFKFTMN